jgi:hypothetical protein
MWQREDDMGIPGSQQFGAALDFPLAIWCGHTVGFRVYAGDEVHDAGLEVHGAVMPLADVPFRKSSSELF